MSFRKLFAASAARKIAKNPSLAENPKLARMAAAHNRGAVGGVDRPSVGGPGDVDAMMGRNAPRKVAEGMKKGGKVKKMAKGGSVSKRADGCCTKGKTKGKFV